MDTKLATKQIRIQQWSGIIRSRNESGMTVNQFCEANGIGRDKYYYWLRKVKAAALEEAGIQFVEVTQPEEPDVESSDSNIQIVHGRTLVNVNNGASKDLLRMVLEVINDVK